MEPITLLSIIGLLTFFIITVFAHKFECAILAIVLGFTTFVAIRIDTTIPTDALMLLYIPLVVIIFMTIVQFWKIKT